MPLALETIGATGQENESQYRSGRGTGLISLLHSLYSSRATYFPTLYHIYAELEGAVLTSNTRTRVPIGADVDVFPSYSGIGYAIFPAYKVLYSILMVLAGT